MNELATNNESFETRVSRVNLFAAERKIAEQLLEIPAHQLAIMTSSDLSERSNASRSSIDRLSRKLGYPGLKEMRKALILERAGADSLPRSTTDNGGLGEIAHTVTQAMAARVINFGQYLERPGVLDALVDRLLSARSVQLFGAGESAALCSTIYMRLVRLGLPVQFSDEYHTQVTLASLMNAQDLAICVSYSGRTKSVMWTAELAKQTGADVAALTGSATSPLARLSTIPLVVPTGLSLPGSAEVLDRLATAVLSEILFQCIIQRRPDLVLNSVKIDDTFGEERL
ncbi:MAG: hypothetical protein DI533_16990 [Cereibacter sphaeroides]|uniref:MurR/RpiR family transcriptional regulator n=1 Tax=Cereibacter sphaeroides TaxID=1063 RepID=A0A2W5S7T3_CERSP|nr:MAG: hypothetical protein DI533_16990 [Cereibacter sphaeroides]